MKKILIVCVVGILFLTACSFNAMNALYADNKKIASDNNSYNLNSIEQKIDEQTFTGNVEFEGMDTIWEYEANGNEEVDIEYLLSLTQGSAKLVLILPDGTITPIVENTNRSEVKELALSPLSLKEGRNRIKLVAKDKANIRFEVHIEAGEFLELGM